MWFWRKITVPSRLIDAYRSDLRSAGQVAPQTEQSLYKLLSEALAELEELIRTRAPAESIAESVRSQRHAYGWSYLSGEMGSRASSSADELFRQLEKQIIRIKGRDWFYHEHWRRGT
jgi:hypothetical protein